MPTYDYKCDACGKSFELFQSITAAPVKKCPHCNKNKARRLIGTGAGLIFKGSGFYITDYRSESYKAAAKSDGGSTTGSSTSGNGSGSSAAAGKGAASTPAPAAPASPKAPAASKK